MSTISRRLATESVKPASSAPMLDKFAKIPIAACFYALIVSPLLAHYLLVHLPVGAMLEPDWGARIFWPALTIVSAVIILQNPSRFGRLTWPPHVLCLFACLALAGASVLWAFKPESSFIRYLQQVMVVTSVVLPALLADRRADMIRALFLCFACASLLNLFFVLGGDPLVVQYG